MFLGRSILTFVAVPVIGRQYAPVAQGIEHRIPNPGAARSNRAGGARNFDIVMKFISFFTCYSSVTPIGGYL